MFTRFAVRCFGLMAMLLVLVSGCGSETASTSGRPFQGESVRVIVPGQIGFRESWEVTLNDWSDQTGASATIDELPVADNLPGEPGTLVVFPATQFADWVSAGMLAPLPGASEDRSAAQLVGDVPAEIPGLGWEEMWPGLRERMASPGQTPGALPVCCPTLVLYYREDLLSRAKRNPPETWDDYQELVASLSEWAPGKIVAEPWGDEFVATLFLSRAISAAQHPGHHSAFFDVESAAPLINSLAYERTLEQMQQLHASLPEANRTFLRSASPMDCRAEILAGRAALAIAWEPGPDAAETVFTPGKPTETRVARPEGIAIGVTRLPGVREVFNPSRRTWEPSQGQTVYRVALTGFSGLAAGVRSGASAKVTDAAWDLAGRLWNTESPAMHPPGTVGPFREADLADISRFVGPGLESAEAEAYALTVAESLRDRRATVLELPVIGRASYRDALTRGLAKAFSPGVRPSEVLQSVSTEWREITARQGINKVRESYRRCLGLEP